MKRFILFFLLALCQCSLFAAHFTLDSTAQLIYKDIFSFNLTSAKSKAKNAILKDRSNLAYPYLELSSIYLDLVNSPTDSKAKHYFNQEEKVLDKLKELPNSEPFKKYAISDIYFHTAIFKMYQGDYFSGGNLVRKSYKLLEENKKAHPSFLINNKNYSLIKIIVGSIPRKYRFIESFSGINGDVDKGVRMLASVAYNKLDVQYKYIQKESRLLYSIALFSVKKKKDLSFRIVEIECADYKTNLFSNYLYAINASMQGENNLVLYLLKQKPKLREVDIHYMDFLYATSKLRKLDYTAINTFQTYLKSASNSSNKYNTYRQLYWAYKLKGEENNALVYKAKAKAEKKDRFAKDFDLMTSYYHKDLLKIRLLYDGGYYNQAMLLLKSMDLSTLKTTDLKLEYYYRYGRTYQELEDYTNALVWLKAAMVAGASSKRYFARKSALESGVIYSEIKNKEKAKIMFTKAIDSFDSSEEHEKSIKQQAASLRSAL